MMWKLYIVQCDDGSLYTGISRDLRTRIRAHLSGKGAEYTKVHRPDRVIYQEIHPDERAARGREAQIKRWSKAKKLALAGQRIGQLKKLSRSKS